jgi:hypothetical protein
MFTVIDTAAAIPAFIGMQNNWWVPFLRMRDKDIYLTDLNTNITSLTNFSIKDDGCVGSDDIR